MKWWTTRGSPREQTQKRGENKTIFYYPRRAKFRFPHPPSPSPPPGSDERRRGELSPLTSVRSPTPLFIELDPWSWWRETIQNGYYQFSKCHGYAKCVVRKQSRGYGANKMSRVRIDGWGGGQAGLNSSSLGCKPPPPSSMEKMHPGGQVTPLQPPQPRR